MPSREGYVYVKFRRDNETRTVPASFIENDDFDMKTFASTRQYWVFWSNDPKQTPETYLQKNCGPIPKIDNDPSQPSLDEGYYKATVSVAASTMEEMSALLDPSSGHKRPKQKTQKCLQSSFEEPKQKATEQKKLRKIENEEKALHLKTANLNNLEEIVKDCKEVINVTATSEKPLDNVSKHKRGTGQPSKPSSSSNTAGKGQLPVRKKKLKRKPSPMHSTSESDSAFTLDSPKKKPKFDQEKSSLDQDKVEMLKDKVEMLEDEVRDLNKTLGNVRKLNDKLIDTLMAKEVEIKELGEKLCLKTNEKLLATLLDKEHEIKELKAKLTQKSGEKSKGGSLPNTKTSKAIAVPTTTPCASGNTGNATQKPALGAPSTSTKPTDTIASGGKPVLPTTASIPEKISQPKEIGSVEISEELPPEKLVSPDSVLKSNAEPESSPKAQSGKSPLPRESSAERVERLSDFLPAPTDVMNTGTSLPDHDQEFDTSANDVRGMCEQIWCEAVYHNDNAEEEVVSGTGLKTSTGISKLISKIKLEFKMVEDYELYPGKVVPAALMQYALSKACAGEKGDSLFTKMMSLIAWGAQHLSEHSVSGGKDPKLSKLHPEKAEEDRRPALDKPRYNAVRNALIYKLTLEKVPDAGSHPRAKEAMVNKYLRDKIKTIRDGFNKDREKTLQEEAQLFLLK